MAMQEQLLAAQQEASERTVVGSAGGGLVRITLAGSGDPTGVHIASEAIDPDDPEILEDLVLAALRDALHGLQVLQASGCKSCRRRQWAASICRRWGSVASPWADPRPQRAVRPSSKRQTAARNGQLRPAGSGPHRRVRPTTGHRAEVGAADRLPSAEAARR
jgi:DNA-binding YbaB/EbfC family protein